MANNNLGALDNPLRRGRFNAGSGYLGPILLAGAALLAVLYMVFGDKLHVDFDIPATAPASTPATK